MPKLEVSGTYQVEIASIKHWISIWIVNSLRDIPAKVCWFFYYYSGEERRE